MLSSLFKILLGNLILNRGPQDFYFSPILMRLSVLAYFFSGLPNLLIRVGFEYAALAMALDTAVLLLFSYICLQAFAKSARFVQTVTALSLVGVVFQLLAFLLLHDFDVEKDAGQQMASFAMLLLIVFSWYLAVTTHIFREAFSVRLPAAMILTICYFFISQLLGRLLLPELA